jgi:Na+/H+ antiporter NhaC
VHPYGWLSLLPPVVAIALAIATRRVIVSLLLGVFVGAVIMAWTTIPGGVGEKLLWTLPVAVGQTIETHLWTTATDGNKLRVFAFTVLMGAMVGIINRSGGMRGLVDALAPLARSRRGGQIITWLLGLLIFFDDYANTLLLGTTLRPLCDRLRISREKLAYLVDSTAAPVAGLAIVSTWVAGEIGFIQDGLGKLPQSADWNAFALFVESIPYRFYVLWSLVLVALVAVMKRDIGPMWQAEQNAVTGRTLLGAGSAKTASATDDSDPLHEKLVSPWYNAVVPVVVTVGVILWALYATGRASVDDEPAPSLMDIFGAADSYSSLVWGSLAGVLTAGLMISAQRILKLEQIIKAAGHGASLMVPALAILLLASVLSSMTGGNLLPADAAKQAEAAQEASGAAEAMLSAGLPPQQAVKRLLTAGVSPADAAALLHEHNFEGQVIAALLLGEGVEKAAVLRALKEHKLLTPTLADFVSAAQPSPRPGNPAPGNPAPSNPAPGNPFPHPEYRLYTGEYLGELLAGNLPAWLLPTVVFLLSSTVSFSTGTSWGTMGIIMPLAIPLTVAALDTGGGVSPSDPILICTVGSVLAGSIFGDHCSPISDTTVLSSQASGCDHMAHVWTQLPYALLVAGLSVVLGTLPASLGLPTWVLLPLGVLALIAVLLLAGKVVQENPSKPV